MKITKETFDKITKLATAYLNPKGQEVNNPKPLNLTPGIGRPPTLQEQIQRIMRTEISKQADKQDMETFEESQDFDTVDSFDSDHLDTRYTLAEEEYPIPPVKTKALEPENKEKEQKTTPKPSEDAMDSGPLESVVPEPEP